MKFSRGAHKITYLYLMDTVYFLELQAKYTRSNPFRGGERWRGDRACRIDVDERERLPGDFARHDLTAGYVDHGDHIRPWLNELALTPVDYRPAEGRDPAWPLRRGNRGGPRVMSGEPMRVRAVKHGGKTWREY